MLPLVECKLEAQDIADKGTDKSSLFRHDKPKSSLNVKEEPLQDCDYSEGSFEDDIEIDAASSNAMDPSSSVSCIFCGSIFESVKQMWDHRLACHIEKFHICSICQEQFDNKIDLSNHIASHQINQLHSCHACESVFLRKADLQNHLVSHQIERPLKCSICGADFQRHSSLANHVKIHTYSPGRALISFADQGGSPNVSHPTSSCDQESKCSDHPWTSKESIPSFETLPSPSFTYQNFLNRSFNSYNFQNNCFESGSIPLKLPNFELDNIDLFADCSSLGLYLNQEQDQDDHCKVVYDEPSAHPGGINVPQASSKTVSAAPVTPLFFLQSSPLWDQLPLETETEDVTSPDINLPDPAFLAVKQMGSLYGIKIEDSLLSSQQGEEQLKNSECTESLQAMSAPSNVLNSKNNLTNQLSVNTSSPFSCSGCDFSCSTVEEFQSHVCVLHNQWKCSLTPKLPSVSQSIEFVGLVKPPASKSSVTNCESSSHCLIKDSYSQKKTAFKHFCVECNKKFATKQKLFRHMWIHRKKQFTCETCGEVFSERVSLDKHRLALHPPTCTAPFACNECGKTFASRQSLWEHGRVHGSAGSASLLWCQECNKTFASRQGYQIHVRTHTGERPYGCRYCYKSFRDGGTLRKHERIHTGERPHACPLCSRAFNQKVVLREHVRWVHAATTTCEPPFSCQLCNTLLSDREELCVHIVKHSDDLAAYARAASKDMGNKLPPKNMTSVGFNKRKALSTSDLVAENTEFRSPASLRKPLVEVYQGEKIVSVSASSISFHTPNNCENVEDNQPTSYTFSSNPSESYAFSPLIDKNESPYFSPLWNTTTALNNFEERSILSVSSVSKQAYPNNSNSTGCTSYNVLPLSKDLVIRPSD